MARPERLLEVNNLKTYFDTEEGTIKAVDGVSFHLDRGETLGVVGESGSGKSVTSLSVMRLIATPPGRVAGGEIVFEGEDLLKKTEAAMRCLRGNEIAMIFQEPMTSLNPVYTVGRQIAEAIVLHQSTTHREALRRAAALLDRVGIPEPGKRIKEYPHQMSGGMRQRVMIAMALSCTPKLLIADEPTTALDVTIQAQILDLMRSLQADLGMSILFITHDLGVIAEMADRVVVLYAGRAVEEGGVHDVFAAPKRPYTQGLLKAIPRVDQAVLRQEALSTTPGPVPNLLEVRNLKKYFPVRGGLFSRGQALVKAVEEVSFNVKPGEVVGLVGESGSGKTTTGRALLRLVEPTAGEVRFKGVDLTNLPKVQMRAYRKEMQIIFQDPFASLNPRMTVGESIGAALRIHRLAHGKARKERVAALLERVELSAEHMRRYPHAFSGGQRQRIGIARALAVNPQFIVADEPVSALDASIQAQVINLLQDLKEDLGLALLFITHDLAVVEYISDTVIVMYLGRIMEIAPAKTLYTNPAHPYTEALLSAIPIADPTARRERILLHGDLPSPIHPPSGCVFRTRCPLAVADCQHIVPPLEAVGPGHFKACIRR